MYGISNSQQQGGGGGGSAASITYTKLVGEVHFESSYSAASNAFFVNADAATWTTLGEDGPKALTSTSDLGLTVGSSYEMYVNIDGTNKSFSGTVKDGASAGLTGIKQLFLTDLDYEGFIIYDHCDFSQDRPQKGNGSIIVAILSSSPTSAKITSFTGTLKTVSPATITNPAIKINSAVTMYINSNIILEGTKTDGSIALSASDEGSVAYEMGILDTPTEGLFVVVNSYIPTIPDIPTRVDYDELQNVPIINDVLNATDFTPVVGIYYRHTGETDTYYTKGAIYKCIPASEPNNPPILSPILSADEISEGVGHILMAFTANSLPFEKTISNTDSDASTKVAIEGTASPYIFRISDDNVYAGDFVRLYPMDEATEDWLNEHTLSSIITEELHKFTFKVDTSTLPTAYSFKYIVECR